MNDRYEDVFASTPPRALFAIHRGIDIRGIGTAQKPIRGEELTASTTKFHPSLPFRQASAKLGRVFDKLLNFIVKATNIQPTYTPEHCLVVTKTVGGCSVCKDICPHDAITIGRQVEIDDVDCSGCGLCVQACPSQALLSSAAFQPGAPVKCSQVRGSAQSVQCLTRLQPSDVLRLAGRKDKVTLVRNDCAACKIGSEAVPAAVDALLEKAQALAAVRGRTLGTAVQQETHYDVTDDPDTLSRRELFRGGVRSGQRFSADLLAPLEVFGETEAEEKGVPIELERQLLTLRARRPRTGSAGPLDVAPRSRRLHHVSGLHQRLPHGRVSP